MKKVVFFVILIYHITSLNAQIVRYSPAWFGPNANPVPEFTDATIVAKTNVQLMADYYFGFGDQTVNGYFKIDIPLLPERVSFKIWSTIFEHYKVTDAVNVSRGMNGNLTGKTNGDFYVQTRISLLKEDVKKPAIILNSTLKTASGTKFRERRYFDTPGYYFDVEIGKSFFLNKQFINEIRLVADLGFLCWETSGSRQNDAPIYGLKLILGNQKFKWENTISGYYGWMHTHPAYGSDYGDVPLVYATKLIFKTDKLDYFAQYQYGINDFPYHQIRIGTSFNIDKLTPHYK
ncbi:MAG: hypothetical protein BGO29_01920 [Bacteroidales bacterium 36-12]|nr:MAG: hypothetical protein BGO29_01920 [Bacteroidales bacterium 36-12]